MTVNHYREVKGFSLIELIAGIVVFSIVMVIVITLVVNQSTQSVAPILQTRAAELAQSLAAEIGGKAFDENSSISGGLSRCGEGTACTAPTLLGPDGESRDNFDDVDDYNGLDEQGANIRNALDVAIGNNGQSLYTGFRAQVNVFYDADFDGLADSTAGAIKHIQIQVTTPGGEPIRFAFFRRNF